MLLVSGVQQSDSDIYSFSDAQYFIITYKGKASEKEYISESLCYTLETNNIVNQMFQLKQC